MSTLRDAMSHAALGWVKPELDETLRQVRSEVEYFVEDPADTSRMRFCAGYLHQVQGTLRMVELYAPAMVAEELEQLAHAVREGTVTDRDEACATLMRGTVLLPDYLERLQNGHRDIPIVLLPLLNEIRAARGAEGINESVLFAFNPDAGNASPAELEHARGSLSGRNRELLDTVGSAVKEELMRIKDALDLHVRMGGDPAQLQTQVNELGAVADTLGVMGLGVARGIVAQQRDALREVVAGTRTIDENLLLDIAGSLLYVDASLDDQVAYLGANVEGEEDAGTVETRRTVEVLAHEAIANFTAARESFVAFIETNWDHQRLAEVPRLLDEVSGALRMLELAQPADYLQAVRQYIDVELIGRRRIPSGRQLDTLADAMASLEYYLEALRERRPGREEILDITRTSLETLRYWPIPTAAGAVVEDVVAVSPIEMTLAAAAEPSAPQAVEVSTSPELPAAIVAAPVAPVASVGPPPLPPLPDAVPAQAANRPEYPLVFGAAIHAKPSAEVSSADAAGAPESDAVADEPVALALDPLALEQPSQDDAGFTLAPLELEGHDSRAHEQVVDVAHAGFDPVAAEADEASVGAKDVYTFDSSLLEFDGADAASIEADAVQSAQDYGLELAEADAFFEPELEELETAQAAGTFSAAASHPSQPGWQRDAASPHSGAFNGNGSTLEAAPATAADVPAMPSSNVPPQAAWELEDAADPETTAASLQVDAETAAFMAELNAAAEAFDTDTQEQSAPVVEPAAITPAAVAGANAVEPLAGGFIDSGEVIDQDIREVFIEEFDEELVNLGELLQAWRAAPANMERLRPVRRVFHTLKGSGRLVGARTLGEFSWKIESMLNRVLDGSRPASPAVVAMVNQAYEVLPELNAALRDNGVVHADLLGMQDVADRIAAGEEAFHLTAPPVQTAAATAAPTEASVPPLDASEGVPASVDSVLREILEAEIGVHLETINAWLGRSASQPQAVSESLLRAVHTMSGAFAMTDVPVITGITMPAESFVKRSLAAGVTPSAAGVEALAQMAVAVDATINALREPSPRIPAFPGVAQRLQMLADALPDATWPPMLLDEEQALQEEETESAPSQSEAQAPVKPELAGVEDLSAYFDPSLLDGSLAGLPAFEGAASESAASQPAAESEAAAEQAAAGWAPVEQLESNEIELALEAPVFEFEVETPATADVVAIDLVDDATPAEILLAESIELTDAPQFEGEVIQTLDVVQEAEAAAVEDAVVVEDIAHAEEAAQPAAEAEVLSVDQTDDVQLEEIAVEPAFEAAAESVEDAVDETVATEAALEAVATLETETETETDAAAAAAAVVEVEADLESDLAEVTPEVEHGAAPTLETEAEQDAVEVEAVDEETVDAFVPASEAEPEPVVVEVPVADEPVVDETTQAEDVEVVAEMEAIAPFKAELAPLTAPLPEQVQVQASAIEPTAAQFDAGALNFDELDRELVDIFVEEGKDLLDHCDGLISELRSAPEDREVLAGLQRDLHTLKGGARMAGVNAIGDLGHSIESLLEAVAANRIEITRGDVQLLERGFDRLHQLLIRTGEHRAVQMPGDLVEAFEARTAGRAEAAPAAVTAAPVEITTAAEPVLAESGLEEIAAPLPLVANEPLSAPVSDEQGSEEEGAPRGQEQVRVRADLLDSLVNHAGEVAIYRSRLEQQLGAFRGAMAELDRTNARLRDQLRRLDLETEAQIVARYRREHEQADQTFDPLELDRFSTLQQLSRALNESAADLGGLQGVLDDLSRNYDGLLQQQSRVSSELQDGLMRARMVPFDGLVPRLRRVVRQAAQETGKQVHLKLEGTHGELDRNVLDRMVAPLEHMLRNSVAHGLELPATRAANGKPEEGEIALRLRREGSEIVLEVADDGAGLDREAIRRRAEQRGLLGADEQIDDVRLDQMIFASGFSTSEQVSQLAGRGVGMDVVRNEVRQLGGSVDIHSERGQGATFTLRLPQTLAVTQAVFARIGETTYAVPVASVSGIGRISRERFESGQGGYHYNGEDFTLYNLGALVGQAAAKAEGQQEIPLLLVRSGDLRAAVAIDQVLGNREIVVKPVGLQIASVPGIYGATITGEGNVVVILDVAPLVRRHLAQPQQAVEVVVASQQRHVPLVMVVDDSLTMRKVTGRVLERHNFEVVVARDGVEALEQLEERVPDLMLLDIEMPRMDGYELATAMRADARYKAVPIVMITSRSGDKHRQRAFEIGVQRYLGKPYQELDLMRNVYDLLGIARVRE
jgi:chemosensory pili system protein ChpA (sensor histidine kinase/response regulator)